MTGASCDGGVKDTLFGLFRFLLKLYTNSDYPDQSSSSDYGAVHRQVKVESSSNPMSASFVVLPKRWIVERTDAKVHSIRLSDGAPATVTVLDGAVQFAEGCWFPAPSIPIAADRGQLIDDVYTNDRC